MKNQENFDWLEKRQSKDPSAEVIHVAAIIKMFQKVTAFSKQTETYPQGGKNGTYKEEPNGNSRTEKIKLIQCI